MIVTGPVCSYPLSEALRWDAGSSPRERTRRQSAKKPGISLNLAALEASLEFVLQAGPETVWQHNDRLLRHLLETLARDRCVLASPAEASVRGPYLCIAARTPEKTKELYEKLRVARIVVSLRQNALRISPYLYNSERDIDRLRMALAV